ncbi:MAG: hypothetical protein QW794_06200 [Thermosphaera sp.]
MVEARFYVGEKEKHEIYVFYSMWTGKLKVDIDGKRVSDTWHWGITKILNFKIGDAEVHEIMIKVSGIFTPHIELYVDGKFVARA